MFSRSAVLALAALLAGCGSESSGEAAAPEEAAASSRLKTVYIRDFAYWPEKLTVSTGDTVVFKNLDMDLHSAVGGKWDTGDFGRGESRSVVIAEPGDHHYRCGPHPSMVGTLVVR